jgi:type II secretion system protein I
MKKNIYTAFVLIEILTSLVIFSISIVFLVQGLSQITKSDQNIRDNSKAMLMAENLLNRIYAGEQVSPSGSQEISGRIFKWEIADQDDLNGLKNLIIKISWTARFIDYKFDFVHKILQI